MLLILPKRSNSDWEKPKDWPFMEDSGKVLDNIPNTWKQYPNDEAVRVKIIDMEYLEFKQAKTKDAMKHELVHLASACLYLWRKLSNVE